MQTFNDTLFCFKCGAKISGFRCYYVTPAGNLCVNCYNATLPTYTRETHPAQQNTYYHVVHNTADLPRLLDIETRLVEQWHACKGKRIRRILEAALGYTPKEREAK